MPDNSALIAALTGANNPAIPTQDQKATALRNAYLAKILDPVTAPSLLAPNAGVYSDQPTDQSLLRQRQGPASPYWAWDLNRVSKGMEDSLRHHTDTPIKPDPKKI